MAHRPGILRTAGLAATAARQSLTKVSLAPQLTRFDTRGCWPLKSPTRMPKTFYIIDGHAHIYRAYFAPFRDLSSPTGEPTKATYVFTQMLLNLIEQRKPDYLAMVIDRGGEGDFRLEIDPEYKANRTAPPEDFKPQEERILQIVKDAGIPIFSRQG